MDHRRQSWSLPAATLIRRRVESSVTQIVTVTCALVALLVLGGSTFAEAVAHRPLCPDERRYSGEYVNERYGFRFVIPAEHEAMWNSAACVRSESDACVCMSDHGRAIEVRGGLISVYASWVPADPPAPAKGVKGPVGSSAATLGGLPASRTVQSDGQRYRETLILVANGVEYSVVLDCEQSSLRDAKEVLTALLSTWQLTGAPR